jgi:hypothetical protein
VRPDDVLNAQIAEIERVGARGAARVQAGAFVASVAMQNACMLSRAADASFRVSPMGDDTYRAILMAYGSLAVTEVQSLSFRDGGR